MKLTDIKNNSLVVNISETLEAYPPDKPQIEEWFKTSEIKDILEKKGVNVYYTKKQIIFGLYKNFRISIRYDKIRTYYMIDTIFDGEQKRYINTKINESEPWDFMNDQEKYYKEEKENRLRALHGLKDCKIEGNIITLGESWWNKKPLFKQLIQDPISEDLDKKLRQSLEEHKYYLVSKELRGSIDFRYTFVPYLLDEKSFVFEHTYRATEKNFSNLLIEIEKRFREDTLLALINKFKGQANFEVIRYDKICFKFKYNDILQHYYVYFNNLRITETECINYEQTNTQETDFDNLDNLLEHIENNIKLMK